MKPARICPEFACAKFRVLVANKPPKQYTFLGELMPLILGVHGVGHQFGGGNMLHANWLPALKDGLAAAGSKLESDADFSCAFYGGLFRPPGKGTIIPPFDASDVQGWEIDLLQLWWQEAARIDRSVIPPEDRSKISAPSSVQRALNAISQSRFFAKVAERALIFDLKQVHQYFDDASIRLRARKVIEDIVDDRTKVIVAHSLGSVVAYEALCAHPEWRVRALITIGSPIGIRRLIFDRLMPAPIDSVGVFPKSLARWFNIADEGDIVALQKTLNGLFDAPICDYLVNNGARAHDATRYLTSREVGQAIAHGLSI